MPWKHDKFIKKLERALASFDRETARVLTQAFVQHLRHKQGTYPEDLALEVLKPLRRKRQFDLLLLASDGLLQSRNGTFRVREAHAQALLDCSFLASARAVLEELITDTERVRDHADSGSAQRKDAAWVNAQARGLLGRLYKQRYVDAAAAGAQPDGEAIARSIATYWTVYWEQPDDPDRRWHAVNALSLYLRARADGVAPLRPFKAKKLTAQLLQAIQKAEHEKRAGHWDFATAMEVCVAAKRPNDALSWARKYVAMETVDAFEIASTLRQLVEVWQIVPEDERHGPIRTLLEARLLSLVGGKVSLDASRRGAAQTRLESLQRLINAGFLHGELYRLGLTRAEAVARIGSNEHAGVGTGVLVRGGDLHPSLEDQVLLLTSGHVIAPRDARSLGGMPPEDVEVSFLFGKSPKEEAFTTRVDAVVWYSGVEECDACLLRLKDLPAGRAPCPIRRAPFGDLERVLIAGYPGGGELQFSLFDNEIVAHDDRFVQYRAATLAGSSGSPVFDADWKLAALHHAGGKSLPRLKGGGHHQANEGVLLSAISTAIQL